MRLTAVAAVAGVHGGGSTVHTAGGGATVTMETGTLPYYTRTRVQLFL